MTDRGRQDGRRRVMHVITRLDRGGSAQNTLLTAIGHDRTRFRVALVHGREEAQTADDAALAEKDRARLRQAGVTLLEAPMLVREISPVRDALALAALWRVIRKERPAIVHTHTSKAGALGRVAAWLARVENGLLKEWRVYADNKPVYDILARSA